MLNSSILLPVFVQVALVFGILGVLAARRGRAVMRKEVDREVAGNDLTAWPSYARLPAANYINQFEMPVLFYVVVVLALVTRKADFFFVLLEWAFVLSRVVHAGAAVANRVPVRAFAFLFGALMVLTMWVLFAVKILSGA